jgi:hypothetical protein
MPFALLYHLCPDIAKSETRSITVPPGANLGLPAGEYLFAEMFCNEPNCDCRRVIFSVISSNSNRTVAVIDWGWENIAFYRRWLRDIDPSMAEEMQGPGLNRLSEQSKLAPLLLELARNALLADPAYVDRIKRHYALFRANVDGAAANPSRLTKGPRRKNRNR